MVLAVVDVDVLLVVVVVLVMDRLLLVHDSSMVTTGDVGGTSWSASPYGKLMGALNSSLLLL